MVPRMCDNTPPPKQKDNMSREKGPFQKEITSEPTIDFSGANSLICEFLGKGTLQISK